ncbi:hypothetical protein LPJ70_007198, partial [Coemansia sp. RSA 2708]
MFATRAGFRTLQRAGVSQIQRAGMSTLGGGKPAARTSRLRRLGRVVVGGAAVGVSYMAWLMYRNRNPAEQQPYDPTKKTL